jgi:hypothetical protein
MQSSTDTQRMRDLLRRAPRPAPALQRSSSPALYYRVDITADATRRRELRDLLSDIPGLDPQHAGETQLTVMHWQGHRRIETIGHGIFGRDLVVLEDAEGGITLIDRTDHTWFRADKAQVPPVRHAPIGQVALRLEAGTPIDGRETQLVSFNLPRSPTVRHRIWFTRANEFAPFAKNIFCVLLGCADELERAGLPTERLLSLGIPVRSEVWRGNNETPLVRGDIRHLELREADPSVFAVPEGYIDMRNAPELERQFGTAPPFTGKLADFRRGGARVQRPMMRTTGYVIGNTIIRPADEPVPQPGGTAPDPRRTDNLDIPQCLPSTFGAVVALAVEQRLLDDIRLVMNQVIKRLDSFSGSGGNLLINWLEQWSNTPTVIGGRDGLFCLMREAPTPSSPGGHGLLDRLALRQARRAMADGTIGSQIPLDPALLFEVVNVIGSKPPDQRFDALLPASQVQVRERYLNERLGKIALTYKTSTKPAETFYGLTNIQLSDIDFDITFNESGDELGARKDRLTQLDTGNGEIKLHLELDHARGTANVGRWPTTKYWLVLGVGVVGCFFMPALCALLPAVLSVGIFLLSDYAYARVKLADPSLDATLDFVPDTSNVLRPHAKAVAINANISVFYVSYIPTGLHQLVSFVVSEYLSATDDVIDEMESQLQDSLEDLFKETLALRFPPSFGPVPLASLANVASGLPSDHLYLETRLNAGLVGVSPPYVTQVDPDVHDRLLDARKRFTFGRQYAGFVISQNFVNQFVNARWRDGAFNFDFAGAELTEIVALVAAAFPPGRSPTAFEAHIWPAVTPRTVLTPRGQLDLGAYATTFFDDLRLCVTRESRDGAGILEIQFAAQAFTQIGFGGIDPDTKELDLGRFADGFMDLYFDLDGLDVREIHPEVQGLVAVGKAWAPLDLKSLPALAPLLHFAIRTALASRSDRAIPSDPLDRFVQKYRLPAATLDLHMFPFRGNVYGWLGLSGDGSQLTEEQRKSFPNGLLEIFPGGALDISQDKLNCIVGDIIRESLR